MNPYAPLFTNRTDQWVVWFGVVAWIILGAFRARAFVSREASIVLWSEWYCYTITLPVFVLSVLLAVNMGVGLLLMWLKVVSVFWLFWQLLYLLSVIAVFQVFPFICAGLIFWAAIGRWHKAYAKRTLVLPTATVLMLCVYAVLYVTFNYFACRQ